MPSARSRRHHFEHKYHILLLVFGHNDPAGENYEVPAGQCAIYPLGNDCGSTQRRRGRLKRPLFNHQHGISVRRSFWRQGRSEDDVWTAGTGGNECTRDRLRHLRPPVRQRHHGGRPRCSPGDHAVTCDGWELLAATIRIF